MPAPAPAPVVDPNAALVEALANIAAGQAAILEKLSETSAPAKRAPATRKKTTRKKATTAKKAAPKAAPAPEPVLEDMEVTENGGNKTISVDAIAMADDDA